MVWTITSIILLFLGMAGSVIPFLPGPPLAWAGLFVYGISNNFQEVSVLALVIFGALTSLTIVVDIFAPTIGAKGAKATKAGIIGSFLGGLIGIFVIGPIGVVAGPFIGAFFGEYLFKPDAKSAMRSAWGAFIGFLVGAIFKFTVSLAMLGYFVWTLIK